MTQSQEELEQVEKDFRAIDVKPLIECWGIGFCTFSELICKWCKKDIKFRLLKVMKDEPIRGHPLLIGKCCSTLYVYDFFVEEIYVCNGSVPKPMDMGEYFKRYRYA